MTRRNQETLPPIYEGSDNAFEDLGLPDAKASEEKVRLAVLVNREIRKRGLRQTEAARLFKSNQAEVSRIANYKLDGVSERRLMEFLNLLGLDVEIMVKPARGSRARTTVRELEMA